MKQLFYWTESNEIKTQKLLSAFEHTLCCRKQCQKLGSFADQPGTSRALFTLQEVRSSLQVQGSLLGFMVYSMLPKYEQKYSWNYYERLKWNSSTLLILASHQITYFEFWHSHCSLYIKTTHAPELLEENNQRGSFLNLQIQECPTEKWKVTMPLDRSVAFHNRDGQHKKPQPSSGKMTPRHSCL